MSGPPPPTPSPGAGTGDESPALVLFEANSSGNAVLKSQLTSPFAVLLLRRTPCDAFIELIDIIELKLVGPAFAFLELLMYSCSKKPNEFVCREMGTSPQPPPPTRRYSNWQVDTRIIIVVIDIKKIEAAGVRSWEKRC